MADSKSEYSTIANDYIRIIVPNSSIEKDRYNKSKNRESRFNENWMAQKVNLNDIVNKFIPEGSPISKHTYGGIKFVFEGPRYQILCDKGAGYLRIFDKQEKMFCLLDGSPSDDQKRTHFKIMKREEM